MSHDDEGKFPDEGQYPSRDQNQYSGRGQDQYPRRDESQYSTRNQTQYGRREHKSSRGSRMTEYSPEDPPVQQPDPSYYGSGPGKSSLLPGQAFALLIIACCKIPFVRMTPTISRLR